MLREGRRRGPQRHMVVGAHHHVLSAAAASIRVFKQNIKTKTSPSRFGSDAFLMNNVSARGAISSYRLRKIWILSLHTTNRLRTKRSEAYQKRYSKDELEFHYGIRERVHFVVDEINSSVLGENCETKLKNPHQRC